MNEEFKSLSELYNRIKPALTTKRNELKLSGMNYIKEEDIWNCIKEQKWVKTSNLTISEMVNDILDCNIDTIDRYIKNQMIKIERKVNFDSIDSLF